MGHSYIVVGCGVFGLTTALELSAQDASCTITMFDRHEPPVPDAASVDSSRIIRADYGDQVYADLALRAQKLWRSDEELKHAYHECGMLLNTADTQVERGYLDAAINSVKNLQIPVQELNSDEILERITCQEVTADRKGLGLRGYINPTSGFADARMGIEILYRRAKARPNITFNFSPVIKLIYADGHVNGHLEGHGDCSEDKRIVVGVQTAAMEQVHADTIILAMGAWQLADLPVPAMATGQVIGYIPLTEDECAKYAKMPVHINFSTGWFCIPPYQGHLKVARHAEGYLNTEHISCGGGTTRYLSVPRTALTHDETRIPFEGERALRDGLRMYLPELAVREFSHSRVCWYTDTATSDFIVDWHPHKRNLFIATGGSGHGYKFLPILGQLITSVLFNTIENAELKKKWSFSHAVEAFENGIKGDGSRGKGARLEWSEL